MMIKKNIDVPTGNILIVDVAKELRKSGYEVLVFIASEDEDKGMITCGNAVLAHTQTPRLRVGPLNFKKQ